MVQKTSICLKNQIGWCNMDYVNENTMNNGLCAKIINVNGVHDIDILFENGVIVRHKDYYRFLLGQIKCPMIYKDMGDCIKCENPNTGDVFAIDKVDLSKVIKHKFWHIDKSNGYVKTGKGIYLHRLLTNCPNDMYVDHINGCRVDNRCVNLRICTKTQNSYNQKTSKSSTTKIKGVTKRGNKYRAKISKNRKQYCIGTFENVKDATIAYDKYCVMLFGDFAKPNITETKIVPERPKWL